MKNRVKWFFCMLSVGAVLCLSQTRVEATVRYTAVQTSPSTIVMGTQPVTYRITNNSTNNEQITQVRFYLANNTYTSYPNPETFIAPTGWTCTRSRNTRISCTAGAGYQIPTTGTNYRDFTFNIRNVVTTYDTIDKLSSVRGYVGGTYYAPTTLTTSWTWKALQMTLTPAPTSIGTGCTTTLTMTVTNRSSVNNLVVASVPSPRPTAVTANGAVINSPTPVPASLTLAANGGTGSIVWAYTVSTGWGHGHVYRLRQHGRELHVCYEQHKDLKQRDDRSGDRNQRCCLQFVFCHDQHAGLSLFG